jgi:hypothetical protein
LEAAGEVQGQDNENLFSTTKNKGSYPPDIFAIDAVLEVRKSAMWLTSR